MKNLGKIFIADYFEKQVDDIHVFLKDIPGYYKMKDIHQLRVRIKRLKAIFRLLEFMHPVKFRAKDHYRLFKPVFKTTGLVRGSQMNLSLLKRFKGVEQLYKSFSKYIARLRPGWNIRLDNSIATFNVSRLNQMVDNINGYFSRYSEMELVGLITDFIYSERDRIKILLDESEEMEYIHEVRIILKNIKPLLAILLHRDDNPFQKIHYKSLNSTETLIGNWHDRFLLSEALSGFFKARGKKKEKLNEQYSALKKKINSNNRQMLRKIARSLEETLSLFY
ncbi:MAG TPA: hypothetical protein DEQ09_07415 [Bacteroidales bacterium]|nr:hypothetical protein [Bacteroidales bacterium]